MAGAVPVAPCVVAAFAFSGADNNDVAAVLLSAAMVALVAGAALSVLRYRLYDVERVVTDSAAYAIASVAVIAAFVVVVVVISRSTPLDAGSQLPTVAATLAGVAVARVSYVWGRRAVGRRVNPERFDAVERRPDGLAEPSADLDDLVTQVARTAQPRACTRRPAIPGSPRPAMRCRPGTHGVDVRRHGTLVARLEFDPAETDRDVVEAVAARRRRDGQRRAASRARAQARADPRVACPARDRAPRGAPAHRARPARRRAAAAAGHRAAAPVGPAQQRRRRLVAESDRAIAELQVTVQELRDLAAGLQPAALAGGGLLAAVADLADRVPLEITLRRRGRAVPVRASREPPGS